MNKRILSLLLTMLFIFSCAFTAGAENAETVSSSVLMTANGDSVSYSKYIAGNGGKTAGKEIYSADISTPVVSPEDGNLTLSIDIKTAGLYNLEVEYACLDGNISAIERKLLINSVLLFEELEDISFERAFKDESKITQDDLGNDIIPSQIEEKITLTKRVNDISGYYNEPYRFYFEAGTVELCFVGIVGNMEIKRISAVAPYQTKNYKDVLKDYGEKGYKNASEPIEIAAENSHLKSSYTLVPTTDRSSPITKPYSASKIKLNTIGGDSWATTGMWIEWKITVPETALYKINFRYRQNEAKGVTVFRKLSIDGAVPFKEAENLAFKYNRSWNIDGYNDYLYYLEKGEHILRLESVLGDMGEVLKQSEEFMYRLNSLYREIITVTGTSPDIYRDYKIEQRIDRLGERLKELSDEGYDLIERINKISGGKNSVSVLLESFAEQLKKISKEPSEITEQLSDFKNNIISLGETISEMRKTPLELDYIYLSSQKSSIPEANGSFWLKIKHELTAFILSFIEDYSSFASGGGKDASPIEVWVSSGREQANIIKTLITSGFSAEKNIGRAKARTGRIASGDDCRKRTRCCNESQSVRSG